MAGEKEFKVRITAQDDGFGATLKKAKADLDSAANIGGTFGSALTGGILGGGIIGILMTAVDKMTSLFQEAQKLARIAQDLSIPSSSARTLAARAAAVGANENDIFSSIDSAAKARADALAGEPTAIEAFKRLGLELDAIQKMSPDRLFLSIADSLKGVTLDAERLIATRRVIGNSADPLMPFFVAGTQFGSARSQNGMNLAQIIKTAYDARETLSSLMTLSPNPFKADVDPISTYQFEREQATRRLRENNNLRADAIARSQLSTEEQITDLVRQRLELNRLIELESSEFRKEQLRSRSLETEEQINRLRAAMDKAALKATNPASSVLNTRNIDELYRSGIFTGGRPTDLVDTVKRQLDEQKISNQLLRNLPLGIAKKI